MKKELAYITNATLEIQDRDILMFYIHVDYESGCSQGVGGIVLDEYDEDLKRRIGTAYGCEMIIQLLKTLGVNNLDEAKGKTIFVLGDGEGFSFKPKGIQMLRSDGGAKLIFDDILKTFEER